jgi:hypothetical protein
MQMLTFLFCFLCLHVAQSSRQVPESAMSVALCESRLACVTSSDVSGFHAVRLKVFETFVDESALLLRLLLFVDEANPLRKQNQFHASNADDLFERLRLNFAVDQHVLERVEDQRDETSASAARYELLHFKLTHSILEHLRGAQTVLLRVFRSRSSSEHELVVDVPLCVQSAREIAGVALCLRPVFGNKALATVPHFFRHNAEHVDFVMAFARSEVDRAFMTESLANASVKGQVLVSPHDLLAETGQVVDDVSDQFLLLQKCLMRAPKFGARFSAAFDLDEYVVSDSRQSAPLSSRSTLRAKLDALPRDTAAVLIEMFGCCPRRGMSTKVIASPWGVSSVEVHGSSVTKPVCFLHPHANHRGLAAASSVYARTIEMCGNGTTVHFGTHLLHFDVLHIERALASPKAIAKGTVCEFDKKQQCTKVGWAWRRPALFPGGFKVCKR